MLHVDCIHGVADSILLSCHGKGPYVDHRPSFIKQGDSLSIRPQEESRALGDARIRGHLRMHVHQQLELFRSSHCCDTVFETTTTF